ncbi:MAG: hypothetical protein M0R80_08830 [Proteobacteria bacterium]|jgi:hypothetical protein|nr:hypothetical protein [Pseudomonadota bacterium]
MDYFVTVVPSYQHFWQVELLIESFKMLKMQDRLLVAIVGAPTSLPTNLHNHSRKIFCSDFNESSGLNYPPINKIACLRTALHALDSNFTLLHTDMVMVGPVPNVKQNICFTPSPPPQKVVDMLQLPSDSIWVSFDGATIFNQVPTIFFDNVLEATKILIDMYGTEWPASLAAWNSITHQHNLSILGAAIESPLTQTSSALLPFVHYKAGLPPYFSKHAYNPEFQIINPYNAFIDHNPNFCTNHVRNVILAYQKNTT